MNIDKSLLTNLVCLIIVLIGLSVELPNQDVVLNIGLFALSGGVTNWLAIHMLFERVPGFYGSGVIPLRFEEFKAGIRKMIMGQFFNLENIDNFFQSSPGAARKLDEEILKIIDELNLDEAFESLVEVIMSSSFGSMLGMVGGRDALNPLKQPFVTSMKDYFKKEVDSDSFRENLSEGLKKSTSSEGLLSKIEKIVDDRLDELTPQLVKEIIQQMIKSHLGWLVVWGGVLGGTIGLAVSLFSLSS